MVLFNQPLNNFRSFVKSDCNLACKLNITKCSMCACVKKNMLDSQMYDSSTYCKYKGYLHAVY